MSQEEQKRRLVRLIREALDKDKDFNIYLDPLIADSFISSNLGMYGFFGSGSRSREVGLSRLEQRIEDVEKKYDDVLLELQEIKGLLWKKESKKEDSILEYKEKASKIKNVLNIYCKPTQDGVDFLILINPEDISNTLRELISLQIEHENKYSDIFFDFRTEPIAPINTDTTGWSPVYVKV
ncbi:MAG: hypothetical protein ABIJ47_13820 [Candidatus Bathyarchaeota archaeon]